jgi:SAM-dependent methyltransferase
LAERTGTEVTGISLSAAEIDRATRLAAAGLRAGRIRFRQQSFDDLPPGSFDWVIAVESLKHSADLVASLGSIVRALRPDGGLVIVEDLFAGDRHSTSARQLTIDWQLTRLYTESDYVDRLGAGRCEVVDLSSHVRRVPPHWRAVRSAALAAAIALARPEGRAALRAFRGGLHLEHLYAAGAMTYKALVFTNDGPHG